MGKIIRINDNKFKSIYFSYNFTLKLDKEEIAKSVISCFTLSKGSKNYNSTKDIEKYLSTLYGANFEVVEEKIGDLYNFEFKIECINKKFLPNGEDVLIKCLKFIYEIIYNPKIENNAFDNAIFEREKQNVIYLIDKRKDEKTRYAVSRAEELMCKETPAGSFIYGSIDDAKAVTNLEAYSAYKKMLNSSYVTVIISGNLDGYDTVEDEINNIFNNKLNDSITIESISNFINMKNNYENGVIETKEIMDTVQSVICVGMKNAKEEAGDFYVANVYNTILGSSPSSKLFQNVREKESLAYTARSRYYRFKKMYIIYAGIEEKNYDKAKEVILKQIDDMKIGNITETEIIAAKESLINDIKEWKDSKVASSKQHYINNIIKFEDTVEDMVRKINSVTLEDIVNYAKGVETKIIYLLGGEK